MDVIIIEDEEQTAWDVRHCVEMVRPHFKIQAVLDSVESSVEWLSNHPAPNLIISDIQLGDGLAFEIFKKVRVLCPIIFCTAYNEYAIQAFQNNGIDYLLKPINEQLFEKSLAKLESMAMKMISSYDVGVLDLLIKTVQGEGSGYKNNFLVPYRGQLIPIGIDDISFFCIGEEFTELHTKDSRKYNLSKTLDYLELAVDPGKFFRANRQFLVAHSSIKHIEHYDDRKLLVKLDLPHVEPIIVSKAKASEFLKWMER